MEKFKSIYLRTILVVLVILGILASISIGAKILKTSVDLFGISLSIHSIEDVSRRSSPGHEWSPELVEDYNTLQTQRQAIYQSEDLVVRTFANMAKVLQLLVIAIVITLWVSYIVIPVQFIKNLRK